MKKNMHTQPGQTLDLFTDHVSEPILGAQRQWTPIYRIELVRERRIATPTVTSPADVAPILCDFLARADREYFVVVMLATNCQIIGINVAHVGSINASIVNVREVFKPAILANAASIICAHNHPSGNLQASSEDVRVSKRLVEAGKLIEIPVLDSLVIGHDGHYTSLAERGLLS